MNAPDPDPSRAGLRWLSRDYAELRKTWNPREPFDVLIVGSGYGGSMAAAELAGKQVLENGTPRPIRVGVLERGKEYAPGMFASSLQELPPHLRVHRSAHDTTMGPLEALLDLRLGPDVSTLLGNGLGGGSLINAGVMEKPRLEQCERLPQVLRDELTDGFFDTVKAQLGASTQLHANPNMPQGGLPKTNALRELARAGAGTGRVVFRPAAITVQVQDDPNDPDVPACTLCGDCMTGCNVGAKKSLDTTLLRDAYRQGAEIYTGASVLKIRKLAEGAPGSRAARWSVTTVYTDESLRRRHEKLELLAHRVILAAGTLGSTEILLRSRSYALPLSKKLGQQFSGNGDNLAAVNGGPQEVRTTTDEHQPLRGRGIGPTITSVVELDRMLVQEFAVPAPLKRLFEESVTTARLLHDLDKPPGLSGVGASGCDSFGVDGDAMNNTLLVGLIGHDESAGQIQLDDPKRMDDSRHLEGRVRIHWPEVRRSFLLERGFDAARQLARNARGAEVAFLPNPAWRLLPEDMEFLVKSQRGPVLTVHPLGGCPMGESHLDGVVDDCGRVFDAGAAKAGHPAVHEGLVVLDGSIIPSSLGANPSLLIAAVAKRAAGRLAAEWGLVAGSGAQRPLRRRPVLRKPEHCTPRPPKPTEVDLVERLVGRAGSRLVELTLRYQPTSVAQLVSGRRPKLRVDPARSFVRVYDGDADTRRLLITWTEAKRDERALAVASLRGELDVLRQEPGLNGMRKWRAALCWIANRGTREIWDRISGQSAQALSFSQFKAAAARAAEVRCFEYDVQVDGILRERPEGQGLLPLDAVFHGRKRLTYGLCSNPWRQLTEARLKKYPWGLGRVGWGRGLLRLDGRFLAGQGFPLIRITRQENQMVALAELASWGACLLRMLVSIHLWSFRAPDIAATSAPQLLPATRAPRLSRPTRMLDALLRRKRLPTPEISEFEMEPPRQGVAVRLRLTRYRNEGGPPIALIHGYSASGSTFTHQSIPKPLALYLHERGHDVWVLDLRTSAGLPSGKLPWHFEDAALADIPFAIAHIRKATGAQQVDVIAHCIGSLMFSMALLTHPAELWKFDLVEPADGGPLPKRYGPELQALRASVGRVILFQKAPTLVYSDANVLRAYFMRALRRVILPEDYQFQVPVDAPGVAGGLMDRLLSTMPYPSSEFRRENPFWRFWKRTPWAGFRHRMDALYARDFSLKNIAGRTLASIHDLFGPLNLETVAQAIHFARLNTITDGAGRAIDTQAETLAERWPRRGTMIVHGVENGLADLATVDVFDMHMQRAGLKPAIRRIPGYGHQDCLIGRHADRDVFIHISKFLEQRHDESESHLPVAGAVERPGAQAG